jgi:hypothetical protein
MVAPSGSYKVRLSAQPACGQQKLGRIDLPLFKQARKCPRAIELRWPYDAIGK